MIIVRCNLCEKDLTDNLNCSQMEYYTINGKIKRREVGGREMESISGGERHYCRLCLLKKLMLEEDVKK